MIDLTKLPLAVTSFDDFISWIDCLTRVQKQEPAETCNKSSTVV